MSKTVKVKSGDTIVYKKWEKNKMKETTVGIVKDRIDSPYLLSTAINRGLKRIGINDVKVAIFDSERHHLRSTCLKSPFFRLVFKRS